MEGAELLDDGSVGCIGVLRAGQYLLLRVFWTTDGFDDPVEVVMQVEWDFAYLA